MIGITTGTEGMNLYSSAHLLICEQDKTYTNLNRFNPRTHLFEGEYSLLHNEYARDAYFLSSFLFDHAAHPLMVIHSDDERYSEIRRTYHHYREEDVPRYIQELLQRRDEAEHTLTNQQQVGQLQLLVAKKMIEQEWESVQTRESTSERETYVLLGQDFAFRKSVQTINQVVDFR